ncbi:iron dependent repressor, metal binding and dimerization domain protein [Niallia oryzisoli]|uniref:Manganese transport regulator n=1 Tax=Niallia oryzisoli TaxID=1737571 RepID=A0ABZ2CBB4_9BACI
MGRIGENEMLTSGMKQYMKQIYLLSDGAIQVTPLLVAKALGVNRSAVSRMTRKLADYGLIQYEYYGKLYLTEKGKQLGKALVKQHEVLKQFLDIIGIEELHVNEMEEIEFNMSTCVIERINMLNQYFNQDQSRIQSFYKFCN